MKKLLIASLLLCPIITFAQITLDVELAVDKTSIKKSLVLEHTKQLYSIEHEDGLTIEAIAFDLDEGIIVCATLFCKDELGNRAVIANPIIRLNDGTAFLELVDEKEKSSIKFTATK